MTAAVPASALGELVAPRDLAAEADTWSPGKGLLFVREILRKGWTDRQLGYVDDPAKPGSPVYHYNTIAEQRWSNGDTDPSFGGWVSTDVGATGRTGSGNEIRRRLATDDDIRQMLRTWNPRYHLSEWVRDVQRQRDMDAAEKDRVARLVAEAQASLLELGTEGT